MADALTLVPRFAGDPSREIVQATLRISGDINDNLVPADLRANYARFLSKTYGARARALGLTAKAGDNDDTKILRTNLVPFIAEYGEEPQLQAEAKDLALKWLDDRSAISGDLVAGILTVAAKHGDRALFDRLLAAAKTSKTRRDRVRLLVALGEFHDPALLQQAFALVVGSDFDPRESAYVLTFALEEHDNRPLAWDFFKAHYDAIVAKTPREAVGGLPDVANGFCDDAHRKDAEVFFQERVAKLPGGPRNLAQTLENIGLCSAARIAQEPSVKEFLAKY